MISGFDLQQFTCNTAIDLNIKKMKIENIDINVFVISKQRNTFVENHGTTCILLIRSGSSWKIVIEIIGHIGDHISP